MTVILIGELVVMAAIVTYGLFTLPQWYFRSTQRYQLWECRDTLARSVVLGFLPVADPAVDDLLAAYRHSIEVSDRVTLSRLKLASRIFDEMTPAAQEACRARYASPSVQGLTREQADMVRAFRDRLRFLQASCALYASWMGLIRLFAARLSERRHAAQRTDYPESEGKPATPAVSGSAAVTVTGRGMATAGTELNGCPQQQASDSAVTEGELGRTLRRGATVAYAPPERALELVG